MMLRYTFLMVNALTAGAVLAQPTLTAATSVPAAGQTFEVWSADAYLSTGSAGALQTWEYWNLLLPNNGNHIEYYLDPSATPTSALIPAAELLSTDGGSDTLFWATTGQGLEQVGIRAELEGTVSFTDASLELKLPCTFNTTWSDPIGASYTVSGFPVTRTGTITGHGDAYGTLEMPWELVYPEVLRVKVRRALVDASALGNVDRISNIHYFYIEAQKFPIVTLIQDSTRFAGGGWAVTRRAEWQGNEVGVGVEENAVDQFGFTAYPNPVSDLVTVSMEATASANHIVEVTNATGQLVMTQRMSGEQSSMDVRSLAPGVYQLRLISDEGVLGTQRLVVR